VFLHEAYCQPLVPTQIISVYPYPSSLVDWRGGKEIMALFLLILLIVLAVTGTLAFVLKVALGVALGLILGIALVAAVVGWRIRRLLRPARRWQQDRRSSRVEVLPPRDPPPPGY
jgi:hypothetical protein